MKYIKIFDKFKSVLGKKDVEMSNLAKEAIKTRDLEYTKDDVVDDTTIAPSKPDTEVVPNKKDNPTKRPWRPVPTKSPNPDVKEKPMGIKKKYEEFKYGGVETAPDPVIAPPTTTPEKPSRPWRPVPTKKPRPGVEEKPMGDFDKFINMFVSELKKIKDTEEGKEMIKNIESKYGNI